MITAKWGGTNIKGVIGILNAMIDSNINDEDLRPKPTKTGSAFENAVAKKTKEIWAKIEPQYKGDFRGNMYYSTIRRLVERSTTSDEILKRYKPFRKYQKNSFASNSKITEGGYMADGGYTESGEKLYEIANNMSDKEFQEAYRNLSQKEKDLYESLLRLGDEEKIALVTVLNESKKPKYNKVTWDLHRYAKGGEMAKGGITPQLNDKVHAKAQDILKAEGITENISQKQFNQAYDKAIKEFGYSPAYFKKVMREFGSEYPDDDNGEFGDFMADGGMMADGGKLDEEISKIKSLGGHWQSYDNGRMAGKKDDGYVTIENEADLNDYIYDKTGYIVKNIEVIEKEKNYPYNRSNPYFYDTYLVTLKNGSNFTFERSYGRPNWPEHVNYKERIKITNINTKQNKGDLMAEGGETNGKYREYEMVVLSKDADGKSYNYRFLISARNIDEAKQIATDGWHSEFGDMGETFYKVMTDSKYRMDNGMADGGMMARGGKIYKIQAKNKHDIIPKWEDETFYTGGKKYLSYKDALNTIKKFQGDNSLFFMEFKVVEDMEKMASGGYMADGGEIINYRGVKVEIRPASKNSNKFIVWDLKSDQIFANEKFDSVADAKLFIEGNKMILVRVVAKDEMSKYADGGMMADGGEVDFNERMAKMRSAYENLNMIVKSRIAVAIGIDRAISIMERDYSIDPFGLITSAVRSGLLELDEINKDLVNEAVYEAERVTDDYRDSGQGIGGSDMTYFTKNVLDSAGYKTGFVNNRLTRVDADGNELVIDKYEMNY